jgi:hypothetical protein
MRIITTAVATVLWLPLKLLKLKRSHGLIHHLIVFFAVAALGAGTLSWASATRRQCSADTCHCQSIESITAEKR